MLPFDNSAEYFKMLFEEFDVKEDDVRITFISPDKTNKLLNGVSLYLKKIRDNQHSYLLIGTQDVDYQVLLSFCFWIPEKIILNSETLSLLEILKQFANEFGIKLKIGDDESYFIDYCQVRLENITDIYKLLNIPDQLLHFLVFSYKDLEDNGIINLEIYYLLCMNKHRYMVWLYSVPTECLKVSLIWKEYLINIRDQMNPRYKSNIEILTPYIYTDTVDKKNGQIIDGNRANELVDFEVPKLHTKPFQKLNELLQALQPNQKVGVRLLPDTKKCIFCDSPVISMEHIFPKWLKRYFPETLLPNVMTIKKFGESSVPDHLSGQIKRNLETTYGYTIDCVCEDCNNTWLSHLEEKAKNILAYDSVTLRTSIEDLNLDSEKANVLSKWIIVKAVLIAIKTSLPITLPPYTTHNLKNGIIHEGFWVEVVSADIQPKLDFRISLGGNKLFRLKQITKEEAESLARGFILASIQIGGLLFRVSFWDGKILKRERAYNDTTFLFPYLYQAPYFLEYMDSELYEEIREGFKLDIFNIGLSLIDYEP